jgi:hypothetical protein
LPGYGPEQEDEFLDSFKESEASKEVGDIFKENRRKQQLKGLNAILRLKQRSLDLRTKRDGRD